MATKTEELLKAIQCLYLEVNASIASDVKRKAVDVLDEKDAEIEKLRMQLAGCGVAALGNTEETVKNRITKDNPYWSGSYEQICDAVDREMANRQEIERLKASYQKQIEDLEQRLGTR